MRKRSCGQSGSDVRCLVISNCATSSYVRILQALKPGWTVKGVVADQARKWAGAEPNQVFIDYALNADVYIGIDLGTGPGRLRLRSDAVRITVPAFVFRGLHPDCINLPEAGYSVLNDGQFQSRIAVICYLLGRSIPDTIACFNRETYEALGYTSAYDRERLQLLRSFQAIGIDLTLDLRRWEATGKFMYTINHPTRIVLFDLLRRALLGRLLTAPEHQGATGLLDGLADELAELIIWPVYPELAARRGLDEPFVWRMAMARGGTSLDLPAFVAATFRRLEQASVAPSHVRDYDRYAPILEEIAAEAARN